MNVVRSMFKSIKKRFSSKKDKDKTKEKEKEKEKDKKKEDDKKAALTAAPPPQQPPAGTKKPSTAPQPSSYSLPAPVTTSSATAPPPASHSVPAVAHSSHLAPVQFTKADLQQRHIPAFAETPPANTINLFVHKLRLCCVMFDWSAEDARENSAKDTKRQQLLELADFVEKNRGFFTDQILNEVMRMVYTNIFRTLPPRQTDSPKGGEDAEEDEPVFEPSWPHLQIVYEFFHRVLVSSELDAKALKKHINGPFVLRLLELFDSEDHRERDYLKTILHRIYSKFMNLRTFIRKAIHNVFFSFIYETERYNGMSELLEILGSIINGFTLPIKAEHKMFLKRVLVPMHKVRPLQSFHQQLSYCVTQFLDKDSTLAVPVLLGLVKYWPITNSAKEILFLNEVEELLEHTQPEEFKQVAKPLFQRIAGSISSAHFQVAERALLLWHGDYISGLICDHRAIILPILYPALQNIKESHWSPTVKQLAANVTGIFSGLDMPLVEQCAKKHVEHREALEKLRKDKEELLGQMTVSVGGGGGGGGAGLAAAVGGAATASAPAAV